MPQFREATEPRGLERERRLGERRRIDRAEAAQRWIVGLGMAWLVANVAMIATTCAGADYKSDEYVVGPIVLAIRTIAGFFAFLAFGAASACLAVTLWNRWALSAGWIIVGVTPWLILILEAAAVFTTAAAR
jgi:hypothetical protein